MPQQCYHPPLQTVEIPPDDTKGPVLVAAPKQTTRCTRPASMPQNSKQQYSAVEIPALLHFQRWKSLHNTPALPAVEIPLDDDNNCVPVVVTRLSGEVVRLSAKKTWTTCRLKQALIDFLHLRMPVDGVQLLFDDLSHARLIGNHECIGELVGDMDTLELTLTLVNHRAIRVEDWLNTATEEEKTFLERVKQDWRLFAQAPHSVRHILLQ